MATHVVREHATPDTSSGVGFLLGALLIAAIAALLIFWGIPQVSNQTGVNSGTPINIIEDR